MALRADCAAYYGTSDTVLLVVDTFQTMREKMADLSYAGDYDGIRKIKKPADTNKVCYAFSGAPPSETRERRPADGQPFQDDGHRRDFVSPFFSLCVREPGKAKFPAKNK